MPAPSRADRCPAVVSFNGGYNPDYSDGSRVGELYKISKKGVFWKSWEGELKLSEFNLRKGGDDGSNVFEFSSLSDDLGQKLQALQGRRVKITYRQWLISPIQQGSSYTAQSVEPVDEATKAR